MSAQYQSLACLQVRINSIDYTLVPPGDLDKSSLPRVPVIRIYGPSSTGQIACVHVHQVYPYLFVEYSGNLNPGHGRLPRILFPFEVSKPVPQ